MRDRDVTKLIIAFDTAVGAFLHQRAPGWEAARKELRATLDWAREIGDIGGTAVPASFWRLAVAGMTSWLEASSPAEREALTSPIDGLVRALSQMVSGTFIAPPDARDAAVRAGRVIGGA